jgi:hypothetical protein
MTERCGRLLTGGQHAQAVKLAAAIRGYLERFHIRTFSRARSTALDAAVALEELLAEVARAIGAGR